MTHAASPQLPEHASAPLAHPPDGALPASVQQALLSLQASRANLRQALMPPPEPAATRHRSAAGVARLWWRRLQRWPAGRLVGEVAQRWWQSHPWRPLGDTLLAGARAQLWPLVRRHPWATVGVAATVGALAVASRPWRWSWLGQRVRRAPAAASGWLMAQLSTAPVQAALAALLTLVAQQALSADNAAQAETPAGDDRAAAPMADLAAHESPSTPANEGGRHAGP